MLDGKAREPRSRLETAALPVGLLFLNFRTRERKWGLGDSEFGSVNTGAIRAGLGERGEDHGPPDSEFGPSHDTSLFSRLVIGCIETKLSGRRYLATSLDVLEVPQNKK